MLTKQEEDFLVWWSANRLKEKKYYKKISFGLPLGLALAFAITAMIMSGWHKRANMVAFSSLNPYVFIIALIAIVVFMTFIYNQFRWEQNDQRYKELLHKKNISDKQQ